jgi:hypothetical protein
MDDSFPPLDEQLRIAYEHTTYRVVNPALDLRIHHLHPLLDALLKERGFRDWAFLTSVNPQSEIQPEDINRERLFQLRKILESSPWVFFEGVGIGDDGKWPPEPGFLLLGISLKEALQLGRQWEQKAIVAGQQGQAAQLHFIPYPGFPDEPDSNR